jgi:molybdopterin-binding protein
VNSDVVIQTRGGAEIVSTNPQEPVESLSRVEENEVYTIRKAANARVGVD